MPRPDIILLALSLGSLLPAAGAQAEDRPTDWCNPTLKLEARNESLAAILGRLAGEHGFELEFPAKVDRRVSFSHALPLNDLLGLLTEDLNTTTRYTRPEDCSERRVKKLTVLPTGSDAGPLPVATLAPADEPDDADDHEDSADNAPGTVDYIYIDDMEQYAMDVLLKKQRANLQVMTPEQRVEYKLAKKRLKQTLGKEALEEQRMNLKETHRQSEDETEAENSPTDETADNVAQ